MQNLSEISPMGIVKGGKEGTFSIVLDFLSWEKKTFWSTIFLLSTVNQAPLAGKAWSFKCSSQGRKEEEEEEVCSQHSPTDCIPSGHLGVRMVQPGHRTQLSPSARRKTGGSEWQGACRLVGGLGVLLVCWSWECWQEPFPAAAWPKGAEQAPEGQGAGWLGQGHSLVSQVVSILPAEFHKLALGCQC